MRFIFTFLILILTFPSIVFAQQNKAPKAVVVTAVPVKEGVTIPTMDITGSVYFSTASSVAAESSGKVDKVFVNEGDIVKAGQPLATLDSKLLSFSIEAAAAQRAQAQASLTKSKNDYERNKILFKQQAIAQSVYEDYLTNYLNAQNAYDAAYANENMLRTEKDKMTIKAPYDGVITSKNVNVGEWVTTGGVIVGMAAADFEARVYIPETVLPFIETGDNVSVTTDFGEYTGPVLSVNSKGDPATRNFLTRVKLGAHKELKEGLLATAKIPSGPKTTSLIVPRDSVVNEDGEKGVFKVMEDKALFVPVTIISNSGPDLAVDADNKLKQGDKIITEGNNMIINGSTIKIVSGIVND